MSELQSESQMAERQKKRSEKFFLFYSAFVLYIIYIQYITHNAQLKHNAAHSTRARAHRSLIQAILNSSAARQRIDQPIDLMHLALERKKF